MYGYTSTVRWCYFRVSYYLNWTELAEPPFSHLPTKARKGCIFYLVFTHSPSSHRQLFSANWQPTPAYQHTRPNRIKRNWNFKYRQKKRYRVPISKCGEFKWIIDLAWSQLWTEEGEIKRKNCPIPQQIRIAPRGIGSYIGGAFSLLNSQAVSLDWTTENVIAGVPHGCHHRLSWRAACISTQLIGSGSCHVRKCNNWH